jgi:hypothetical protein
VIFTTYLLKGPTVASKTFRSIIDDLPAGTIAVSSAITDTKPDPYVYATREEYEAGIEAVAKDETLSPSERDDILASTPEPEETYEEYMERHDD